MLCRGALSYGKLIHDKNALFGPALNEAYFTESKAALYPRIILDKSLIDVLMSSVVKQPITIDSLHFEFQKNVYLKLDEDDNFYIDYFNGAFQFFRYDEEFKTYLQNLRNVIISINTNTPSKKVKYGWLKTKFNKMIDKLNKDERQYESNGMNKNFSQEIQKI